MSILKTILFEDLNDREQKELYKQNKASHLKHISGGAAIGGGLGAAVGYGLGHFIAPKDKKHQVGKDVAWSLAKKGATIGAGIGLGSSVAHNQGLKKGLKGEFVDNPEGIGNAIGMVGGGGAGYLLSKKGLRHKLAGTAGGMIIGQTAGSTAGYFYGKGNKTGLRQYYKKKTNLKNQD